MKEFDEEFDLILNKLQLFEKMYQFMRIVDPVSKKVLKMKENELCEEVHICYEFWEKQKVCDNCISIRAYNENDTIFKMEQKGNSVFMVTAIPILILERKLVVELLKEVTKSLYVDTGNHEDGIKILSTIEYMNQMAVKDELTNIYNRRYINEKLPVDLLNSSLKNEPLSIIFADIDFFKSINDTYGHAVGDQVLREFTDELRKHVREGKDWMARYGGDEFMICLLNTDLATAKGIAERIRKCVVEKVFTIGNEQTHITCSFGVHTVCDQSACLTVDGIIELADKKLYQAKSAGRNKVI